MLALMLVHRWGRGAVGSAPRWHRGGRGFESHRLHQIPVWNSLHKARKIRFRENSFDLADMGRSVLRPYVILPWLGGGGDGVEFGRGLPQGDVRFEFAHHFVEGG